jgi:hypothetical protein
MSYQALIDHFRWENIDKDVIRRALGKRGYYRRVALRKPLFLE